MRRALLFVLAVLPLAAACSPAKEAAPRPLGPGVAEEGRRVFGQCRACHSVQPGVTLVGPSLHGVVGRVSGTLEGYNYSQAMRDARVTWTEAALDAYLENPKAHVPGTKMTFAGLASEQDRRDVIAYLKTQSSQS